jgi:XTP/dITP diphosphohydrolase
MSGIRDRRAHYTCVLVALRSAEDPEPLVVEARWHGAILDAPRGCGGFGYDPLFFVPAEGKAAAELEPAVKNRISHRGLALAELAHRLAEWR